MAKVKCQSWFSGLTTLTEDDDYIIVECCTLDRWLDPKRPHSRIVIISIRTNKSLDVSIGSTLLTQVNSVQYMGLLQIIRCSGLCKFLKWSVSCCLNCSLWVTSTSSTLCFVFISRSLHQKQKFATSWNQQIRWLNG